MNRGALVLTNPKGIHFFTPAKLGLKSLVAIKPAGSLTIFSVIFITFFSSGCASIRPVPTIIERQSAALPLLNLQCDDFNKAIRERIQKSGYQDNQYPLTYQNPELRIDRFYQSFKDELSHQDKKEAWLTQAFSLAHQTRAIELANLWPNFPIAHRRKLDSCENQAFQQLLTQSELTPILKQILVHPNYQAWKRTIGLSKLIGPFVNQRIEKWQFTQAQRAKQRTWNNWQEANLYQTNQPLNKADFSGWLQSARAGHPLGIPKINAQQQAALLQYFAPSWLVQDSKHYNRIGQPSRNIEGHIEFNTAIPKTYTYVSYTRFHQQILLQLNYVIWFSEHPKTRRLDLYGGPLDGLVFRITLDNQGLPLIYDSVHNCGCYHTLFSVGTSLNTIEAKGEPIHFLKMPELTTNQLADTPLTKASIVVVIDSGTHTLVDVISRETLSKHLATTLKTQNYALAPYNDLRLAQPLRLFNASGLIPDTQRLERFLLWPFGIASPGAMRQAGQHAAAFTSIRHFDDARLFENWFSPANE